jgi:hypothetical protein
MPVRGSMAQLISRVRFMIQDNYSGTGTNFFADQDIQDTLDEYRDDIRYELLKIAPSIVNTASTNNVPSTIFADYYSQWQWWEQDVTLQGQGPTGAAWIVLSPLGSDYITGRFQFELTPFTTGTVPGQLPPVFMTGKTYDLNWTAADLCEYWGASFAGSYDMIADGQNLRRSQLMTAKLALAEKFRMKAKPRVGKIVRRDVMPELSSRKMRLLDSDDIVKG